MARSSKARTLERLLSAAPRPFVVDPFVVFAVSEWDQNSSDVLDRIQAADLGPLVVVRSSATTEDVDRTIPPGLFRSALNVHTADRAALTTAVLGVIASYDRHPEIARQRASNEVIVQAQLRTPRLSGIVQAGSGSAYLHVDYDDESGSTDNVTAGRSCKSIEIVADVSFELPEPWSAVRKTAAAVEEITGGGAVVIEFAVSRDGFVHVFQSRKLTDPAVKGFAGGARDTLRAALNQCVVSRAVWSDMADWNPAELVGNRPQPLAVSLYRFLITDKAWLDGRSSLGYRRIQPAELVQTIACKPYVNVGSSFLSLTPRALSQRVADLLVKDRLEFLRSKPWLHDKVETQVLFTVADVCVPSRTGALRARGVDHADVLEIEAALRTLTSSLVRDQRRWAAEDSALSAGLGSMQRRSVDAQTLASDILLNLIRCRDFGVVPFARHARLAFVARDLIARLRDAGAISPAWETQWWTGIRTIVHDVVQAIAEMSSGTMSRRAFNKRFGHLRGRTFDICSPRYDSFEAFPTSESIPASPLNEFESVDGVIPSVDAAFRAAGLSIGARDFFRFAVESTQFRESLKLAFSLLLSDVIEAIADLGELYGVQRDAMAFCTLDELQQLATQARPSDDGRAWLRDVTAARRAEWTDARSIVLPDLILSDADLLLVRSLPGQPNFITTKTSEGNVAVVNDRSAIGGQSLDGKIVAIEAAEPGFDWIFAFRLAGLVTKYGGATSHMAIRCAQMQVPAAIGCGDTLFNRLTDGVRVRLECASERLLILAAPNHPLAVGSS